MLFKAFEFLSHLHTPMFLNPLDWFLPSHPLMTLARVTSNALYALLLKRSKTTNLVSEFSF